MTIIKADKRVECNYNFDTKYTDDAVVISGKVNDHNDAKLNKAPSLPREAASKLMLNLPN